MLIATLKGAMARKLRLALMAIAVVLGVSFVSGTYIYTDTVKKAFNNLFSDINTGVDLAIRAKSGLGKDASAFSERDRVPGELLQKVRAVDGVRAAEGALGGYAQIVDKKGKPIQPMGPPTLGVAWAEDAKLTALTPRKGRRPQNDREVAIDAATAKKYHFHVGDKVTILLQDEPRRTFKLVGIAGFGSEDNLAGATLVAFDQNTAQDVLQSHGDYDTIEMSLKDGASSAHVQASINALIARSHGSTKLEVVKGSTDTEEKTKALAKQLGFFNTALLVFAAVALFVGAFIIANTFSIVVAQRSRELALLRAVGALRRQVMTSVVIEAFVVGLFASAVGMLAGIGIANLLRSLMAAFNIDLPQTALQIEPRTIAASFIVGVTVTVLASIYPAIRASRVSPVEALRGDYQRTIRMRRWTQPVRVLLLLAGVGLLWWGLHDHRLKFVGLGAAGVFLGVALISPILVVPLAKYIGAPAARFRGVGGMLARQNAMRSPTRTAATAIALMVGLALVGFFTIFAASLKASVDDRVAETFKADYIVSAKNANAGGGFSQSAAKLLKERPEFSDVSALQIGESQLGPERGADFLTAVDADTIGNVLNFGVSKGVLANLYGSTVMMKDELAKQYHWKVGDTVPVRFARTGKQQLKLVAIFTKDTVAGSLVIPTELYRKNYVAQLDYTLLVRSAEGTSQKDAGRVIRKTLKPFANLEVNNQAQFVEQQRNLVDQLLGLITALTGLSVIIAVLGIINTLALSVFERTREIGLLRAVGMTRRQTRTMIRWESVVISIIGAVLGLGLGIAFGWIIVRSLHDEGIRTFTIPYGTLTIYVAMAAVAGFLAAIFPGRRAARLNILASLASD
jgi:putative ABC transport system permease protein